MCVESEYKVVKKLNYFQFNPLTSISDQDRISIQYQPDKWWE